MLDNLKSRLGLRGCFQQLLLLALLLLLVTFLGVYSEFFFTTKNWINIFNNHMAHQLSLAIGMTFVIASGGIDLSVASILALSGIVMGLLKTTVPVSICIVIGLLSALAMGTFNGLLVANFSINPLIITLGTTPVFTGLGLIVTGGTPIYQMPLDFTRIAKYAVFGLPLPVIISAAVLIAGIVLLNHTKWGQYVLTTGTNETALKRLGINTKAYKVSVYALCGLLAGVASVIITSRMNVAEATAGAGSEMNAIAAVVMGGTYLSGGKATLLGTTIACLLLSVMKNGLTMMGVDAHWQTFIIGAILLLAVVVTEVWRRRKAGSTGDLAYQPLLGGDERGIRSCCKGIWRQDRSSSGSQRRRQTVSA